MRRLALPLLLGLLWAVPLVRIGAAGETDAVPRGVKLLYWSTREVARSGGKFRFQPQLARAQGGRVRITVPPLHRRAHCERPAVFENEDPLRHIVITEVSPQGDEAFRESLRECVSDTGRGEILIFVHGFKNTFAISGWRAGQLAVDLSFPGTVLMFSWPSQGGVGPDDYFADSLSVAASAPQFAQLLRTIRQAVPSARVHILAHSMGCRLTCMALAHLAATSDNGPVVDQLILAAPDIDRVGFRRVLAEKVERAARRVTLYVSREDSVLALARFQHADRPLLGDSRDGIPQIPEMQIVDVTGTRNDGEDIQTGHRYYAANSSVLQDITQVLRGASPEQRGLVRRRDADGASPHWGFVPAGRAEP